MIERIITTFNKDGSLRGSSATDWEGLPAPLDEKQLKELFRGIETSALAKFFEMEKEIDDLKLRQSERLTKLKEEHGKEKESVVAQLDQIQSALESETVKRHHAESRAATAEARMAEAVGQLKSAGGTPRGLPVHANNKAATEAGLAVTDFYRNPSGQVMTVF